FGNWLENMVDWNLSRSRFWGTPLPIWRTEDGIEEKCIGTIEELNSEIKKAIVVLGNHVNENYLHQGILDLHKPFVDDIVLVSESGRVMTRIPDLIDVWFDSGAMPYAQWGLPDSSSNKFGPLSTRNFWKYHAFTKGSPLAGDEEGSVFPADFIAEGVDQTRGWFYTLHALGVLLFDSVAYKTVVSNGLVLDKSGNKMSKRIGNVIDPFETLNIFGPDATRWYLITNASPWDSLKFDIEGIKEVQRKFFGTLYNTYQFFVLYANVDGFHFKEKYIAVKDRPEIDQWILSSLNSLIKNVQQNFDEYEPTAAGRAIEKFVDEHLSNWYVRLSRRRFWKPARQKADAGASNETFESDKVSAYQTLYECLETLSCLVAPIAPFFADWLFEGLNSVTKRHDFDSVHHMNFPKADASLINTSLEDRMQIAQDVSSLILSLRKKVNQPNGLVGIKVRQPLQKAIIPAIDVRIAEKIKSVEEIIKAETNVKEIVILAGDNTFIRKKAKANFKTLGKKLGQKMKTASEVIQNFKNAEIDAIQVNDFLLNVDYQQHNEEPIYISYEDIEVTTDEIPGFEVAGKGPLTVALDIVITDELKMEGEAREFINRVQNLRKEKNLDLTDKINVKVSVNEALTRSITEYYNYICAEILADKLEFIGEMTDGSLVEVNGIPLKINIIKKGN
ncbi:MAG: class I tRNA ligase family protein, partial [Chitinophagaceae bacterium]|nr:class I tRNA ligase family protein [Chitinophagaceae bacterium]